MEYLLMIDTAGCFFFFIDLVYNGRYHLSRAYI